MSIAALAAATSLSKGHLSSVERGLVLITVNTVVAAAKGFDVPFFYLVMFTDQDRFSAVLEHVRLAEGGDPAKVAAKLRKLVFGQVVTPDDAAQRTASSTKKRRPR